MIVTTNDPFETLKNSCDYIGMVATSGGVKYSTEFGQMLYRPGGSFLKRKDFSLFKHVKANAGWLVENEVMGMPEERPDFVSIADYCRDITCIRDCYEIDLVAAYWKIARQMGLCDRKTFDKYMTKDKRTKLVRNMSIGSLATRKEYMEFSKDKGISFLHSEREKTFPIFWQVAYVCDRIMRRAKIISGDNFLFYWVDAVFVLPNKAIRNDICSVFHEEGFDFKIRAIDKITRLGNQVFIRDAEKVRTFNIPDRIKIHDEFNTRG